jgi:multidrug resistance efflux pump
MNPNRNLRTVVVVLLLVAVAGFGYYYFVMRPAAIPGGALTASGTVETTEISIASELAGKVQEVKVTEGDNVKAGDALFVLDSALLKAQRNVAAAGLETAKSAAVTAEAAVASAQIQVEIALNAAMLKDKPTRTVDMMKGQPGEFTLPLWYYNQGEQISAAQAEVEAAIAAMDDAQAKLASVQKNTSSADFVKAEADLSAAQASYQVANDLNNRIGSAKNIDDATRRQLYLLVKDALLVAKGQDARWVNLSSINSNLVDASQKIFDDAKATLKDAQSAYTDAISTSGAKDVLKARAVVSIAQERYYTALDFARKLETGTAATSVTAVQKGLEQAKSAAAQAQAAVNQAQANVDLYDAQIAKTIITSPVDGVVLTRAAEPGSVVNPGGIMLMLGRLDELTITVYVPEDRVGEVVLGEAASVSVDSFPGQTFTAIVTYIANQAEFTPRNVQTVDGRKNTVFAVKLKLDNTSGSLKPGMPADVIFGKK